MLLNLYIRPAVYKEHILLVPRVGFTFKCHCTGYNRVDIFDSLLVKILTNLRRPVSAM